MAKKFEFDFKSFMLQHGERVGLGIAGGFMAILLITGVAKLFGSSSASTNASKLDETAKGKQQQMNAATPPEDLDRVDPRLLVRDTSGAVDGTVYTLVEPPVQAAITNMGNKRRPPRVLMPEEAIARMFYAQLDGIALLPGKESGQEKVMVVRDGAPKKDVTNYYGGDIGKGRTGGSGGYGAGGYGAGGYGAGGSGLPGSPGGPGAPGAPPGMPGSPGAPGGQGGYEQNPNYSAKGKFETLTTAEYESLKGKQNIRLADVITPRRMVVVAGSFPYRKQLDEFRDKLRYQSLYELMADQASQPQFKRIEVQRRAIGPDGLPVVVRDRDGQPVLGPDGQPVTWANLDVDDQMLDLMVTANGQVEPNDPEFDPVSFYGLVKPRPKQMREGLFPKVEGDLKLVRETLEELKGIDKKKLIKPKAPKLGDKSRFDPNSPTGMSNQGQDSGMTPPPTPSDSAADDLLVPKHCLFRFWDQDIRPGVTYEYRLRIVMANPNFQKKNVAWSGLARTEEIAAQEWYYVPEVVPVPPDTRYYVMEKFGSHTPPNPNQVAVQIQRWVDYITKDPSKKTDYIPVGDWVIAPWTLINRGERLNLVEMAEVPAYDAINDSYYLIAPAKGATKRIPVIFGPRDQDILLVDFEGGARQTYLRPSGEKVDFNLPREVLILGADGLLEVHNQDLDTGDARRDERFKAWEKWIGDIKRKGRIPAMPGMPGGPGGGGSKGS